MGEILERKCQTDTNIYTETFDKKKKVISAALVSIVKGNEEAVPWWDDKCKVAVGNRTHT